MLLREILDAAIATGKAGYVCLDKGQWVVCFGDTHGYAIGDEIVVAVFNGCHPYWTNHESLKPCEIY